MEAGKAYRPAKAGFVGDAYTPANEMGDDTKDRDLVSLNMAAPIRSMTDMRDNPKIINRSDGYIYNSDIFCHGHNMYFELYSSELSRLTQESSVRTQLDMFCKDKTVKEEQIRRL